MDMDFNLYNGKVESEMPVWKPEAYKDYKWIVADPDLLGGRLAIRDTRLSVSLILECLANGMTLTGIGEAFDYSISQQTLSEVLRVASELTESFHVAA